VSRPVRTLRSVEVTMGVELQRRRFTVDDYYAMADAGILHEDDRVELIEGEIIEMAAIGSHHAACVDRLTRLLVRQAGDEAVVRVQNPVRLSDLSEPQPDLALLRPRSDFYAARHPLAPDTLLIIEVAHSTLGYDRGVKVPLYARTGIPELWIVNLDEQVVEVYGDPADGRFRLQAQVAPGAVLRPRLLPSVVVAVSEILP
jgi:Uma2 family endonuclease